MSLTLQYCDGGAGVPTPGAHLEGATTGQAIPVTHATSGSQGAEPDYYASDLAYDFILLHYSSWVD